jgi:hypothetical protein
MDDCTLRNPIAAGRHWLPVVCGGADTAWEVSSSGGREHFLVLASPRRLVEVEAKLAGLAVPAREGIETAREVGTRVVVPDEPRGTVGFRELADIARSEVATLHRAEGVWTQEIVLENPAR